MSLAVLLALTTFLAGPLTPADIFLASGRGTCIEGPHEPLRVRRLPGTPATSSKPENPLEDKWVHCSEVAPNRWDQVLDAIRPAPTRTR